MLSSRGTELATDIKDYYGFISVRPALQLASTVYICDRRHHWYEESRRAVQQAYVVHSREYRAPRERELRRQSTSGFPGLVSSSSSFFMHTLGDLDLMDVYGYDADSGVAF
jgi:hypothetical protein